MSNFIRIIVDGRDDVIINKEKVVSIERSNDDFPGAYIFTSGRYSGGGTIVYHVTEDFETVSSWFIPSDSPGPRIL